MTLSLPPLQTERLQLQPISLELARAIIAGELDGLHAGVGWPHEHTVHGLSATVRFAQPTAWLIVFEDAVIGDGGLHGPIDSDGAVEIGYGLAEPSRGKGFGSEAVQAMTEWLVRAPGVRVVRARTMPTNVASRRVLEKAGFHFSGQLDGESCYEQAAS